MSTVVTGPWSLHGRAAAELRHRVFVEGQGVDPAAEADGLDDHARHAYALDAGRRVIGTGRLVDPGETLAVGRIGRMAVDPDGRGSGVGARLLASLVDVARDSGMVAVELHAQLAARSLYERGGFTPYGEVYLEQSIEHVSMRRELLPGLRQVADADAEAIQRLIGGCWAEYPGCVLDVDGEEPWMRAPGSLFAGSLWVLPGPDGGLLGCCGVKDGQELKSLYVDAAARRRGHGRALLRLAERAGARWLWSDSRFLDAHRLYSGHGWTPTGASRELHDLSDTTELEFRTRTP